MDKRTARNVPTANNIPPFAATRRRRQEGLGVVSTGESGARKPLGRCEWIAGAIDALADEGAAGMCVEALAKRFGVTKGSFYWHFKDRRDLLDAVLQSWKDDRIRAVDSDAVAGNEREQLWRIIDVFGRDRQATAIELAMRDWARRDAQARVAVEAVDGYRLERICRLFVAGGFDDAEASSRSLLLYAYILGNRLLLLDHQDSKITGFKRWIAEHIVSPAVDV